MNQDLIILLLVIAFIAGLILWLWRLSVSKKKQWAGLILRFVLAIVIAIPFLIVDLIIIFVALWENGGPGPDRRAYGEPFHIVNNSSVPLRASANLAYTPNELETLQEQGVDIDLTGNFITYRDVLIPCTGEPYENRYSFVLPIPRYRPDVEWPSGFNIVLSDTLGKMLVYYTADDIDSTMSTNMQIVITDSLLQSLPKIMFCNQDMWQKSGGAE